MVKDWTIGDAKGTRWHSTITWNHHKRTCSKRMHYGGVGRLDSFCIVVGTRLQGLSRLRLHTTQQDQASLVSTLLSDT